MTRASDTKDGTPGFHLATPKCQAICCTQSHTGKPPPYPCGLLATETLPNGYNVCWTHAQAARNEDRRALLQFEGLPWT